MGAIMDILKNRLPLEAHVLDHARSIQQNSKMTLEMFPKGSGFGDTKAKPAIWENWSKFESAAKAFVRESAELAKVAESGDMKAFVRESAELGKVAESGDMKAFAKQFRATGKTCGSCHKNFRKKD